MMDKEGLTIVGTILLITAIGFAMIGDMSKPVSDFQVTDINSKINLVGLKVVSIGRKEPFGCGRGNLYRVPVVVKNDKEVISTVGYCPGNWFNSSEIRL